MGHRLSPRIGETMSKCRERDCRFLGYAWSPLPAETDDATQPCCMKQPAPAMESIPADRRDPSAHSGTCRGSRM
jgi:hypothetical protein